MTGTLLEGWIAHAIDGKDKFVAGTMVGLQTVRPLVWKLGDGRMVGVHRGKGMIMCVCSATIKKHTPNVLKFQN